MKNESPRNLASECGAVAGEDALSTGPADALVVPHLADGEPFGVARIGCTLWALIQEPYRLGDLCEGIVREYEAPDPIRSRRETLEFLRRVAASRLITLC